VVQCGAVRCSVVQCGAVWCSVVQCGAGWCWVVLGGAGWCWVVLGGTGWFCVVQDPEPCVHVCTACECEAGIARQYSQDPVSCSVCEKERNQSMHLRVGSESFSLCKCVCARLNGEVL